MLAFREIFSEQIRDMFRNCLGKRTATNLGGHLGLLALLVLCVSVRAQSAFMLTKGSMHPTYKGFISFGKTVTNVSSSLIPEFGVFMSNANGTYAFTVGAATRQRQPFRIALKLNRDTVATMYGSPNDYQQVAQSAVLQLQDGDFVYPFVEVGDIFESAVEERAYTVFSGFRVNAEAPQTGTTTPGRGTTPTPVSPRTMTTATVIGSTGTISRMSATTTTTNRAGVTTTSRTGTTTTARTGTTTTARAGITTTARTGTTTTARAGTTTTAGSGATTTARAGTTTTARTGATTTARAGTTTTARTGTTTTARAGITTTARTGTTTTARAGTTTTGRSGTTTTAGSGDPRGFTTRRPRILGLEEKNEEVEIPLGVHAFVEEMFGKYQEGRSRQAEP